MRNLGKLTILLAVLCLGPLAYAEEPAGEGDGALAGYGMAVYVGGGVGGFMSDSMRAFAPNAPRWDVRVQLGTNRPLSLEAAYTGGLLGLSDTLGVDKYARLLESGAEADLRLAVPAGPVTPFFFAGAGWLRVDLVNYDTRTADVADHDDLLVLPVGLGLSYHHEHRIADVRGTYRFAFDEDLLLTPGSRTAHADMDEWVVSMRVGFEL